MSDSGSRYIGIWTLNVVFSTYIIIMVCALLQLSGVTLREVKMRTSLALCEHVEKTSAAISLRQIHSEYVSN